MEKQSLEKQFLEMYAAVQSFLQTDAAYGPADPRTADKRARLANVMEHLVPGDEDVPQLYVVGSEPGLEREPEPERPKAPIADPQRWSQVRAGLVQGQELPPEWVDGLHERGRIYADLRGDPVFLGEGERPFTARLPAEDTGSAPVLILAEDPVEALSALEMHRRLNRDRMDGRNERGDVVAMAAAEGAAPHEAIQGTLDRGGIVRIATANNPAGEAMWQEIRERYPTGPVERYRPRLEHWNEVLRFENACIRDPVEADRLLREEQRANAPDAQAREATRKAVQRLAPARNRDPWERER